MTHPEDADYAFAMRVDTCLLCEAVTVHDGLLNILGGGVTVVQNAAYPAELGLALALRIMVHPTELAHPHKLEIVLQDDDGAQVTKVDMGMEAGDTSAVPVGEEGEVLVPWNFPGRPALPHAGRYSFELLIDGVHQLSVPLKADETGGPS
jgi:hypothetical protein